MDSFSYIIIGIVVFIVISIFRSVAKKKKAQERSEQSGQQQGQSGQQPVRPPAMSDIQRAFSMMGEMEPKPAPRAATPRPIPARQPAAYSSTQGKSLSAAGNSSLEGTLGKTEGRASTLEGKAGRTEGRASTHEGKAGKTEGREFHGAGAHKMPAPYKSTSISSVTFDESEDDFGNAIGDKKYAPTPKLKLFEKQSDYMKAVIFSEILPRRSR